LIWNPPVVVLVAISVGNRRAFDEDYGEDYDKDV